MALFRRAAPPSSLLLLISLGIGLAAMGAFAGAELLPAVQYAVRRLRERAPSRPMEDGFSMARFCRAHDLLHRLAEGGPRGPH